MCGESYKSIRRGADLASSIQPVFILVRTQVVSPVRRFMSATAEMEP